jgi:pimeloyl-ACP methyl ester carboxylesterase
LRKRVFRLLAICGAIYLLACIGCASFQRKLIYFPAVYSSEQVEEWAGSEKIERWKTPSGEAVGWKRLSSQQPAQGSVIITHGNACCAFQCSHYADSIQSAAPMDVFILEYPGYADCNGQPTERSIYLAAIKAFESLPTNAPIYLVGESLGTGVAAYLAGRYPESVRGIALLAPYPCLADVAQAHMKFLPVRWLLSEHFPSEEHLRKYRGPVAVLVGGQDTVVPQRFGRKLYERYTGPKRLWEFPELDHDRLMDQPPAIWKQIVVFWREH